MVNSENFSILRRLVDQWSALRSEIGRLRPGVQIRPDDINTLLSAVDGPDDGIAYFEFQPMVFNLPERATHADNDLYVVVEGRLSYRRQEFRRDKRLLTHSFATH